MSGFVEPQGTITLTHQPFDNSYKYVKLFTGFGDWKDLNAAQKSFFTVSHPTSKPVKVLFDQNYTRVTGGVIRVSITFPGEYGYENAPQYNYLAFSNYDDGDGFARTWFAFITNWNYINDNLVEFHYELDLFQNFAMQGMNDTAYIERGHVRYDYGMELINADPSGGTSDPRSVDLRDSHGYLDVRSNPPFSEPIDAILGNPIKERRLFYKAPQGGFQPAHPDYDGGEMQLAKGALLITSQKDVDGTIQVTTGKNFAEEGRAFFSPFAYDTYFPAVNVVDKLEDMAESGIMNGVVGLYCVFLRLGETAPIRESDWGEYAYIKNSVPFRYSTGKKPRIYNNKALLYPYRYLEVDLGGGGQIKQYAYEDFLYNGLISGNTEYAPSILQFRFLSTSVPEPSFAVIPVGYQIYDDIGHFQFNNGLSIVYPPMSYSIDAYQNWFALNNQTMAQQIEIVKQNNAMSEMGVGMQLRSMASGTFGMLGGAAGMGNIGQRTPTKANPLSYDPVSLVSGIGGAVGTGAQLLMSLGDAKLMKEVNAYQQKFNLGNLINAQQIEDFQAQRLSPKVQTGSGSFVYSLTDGPQPRAFEVRQPYGVIKKVDEYFSLYGYCVNDIGNVKEWAAHRPVFNFVKTKNYIPTDVDASIDVRSAIGAILDRGVTFIKTNTNEAFVISHLSDYFDDNAAPNAFSKKVIYDE